MSCQYGPVIFEQIFGQLLNKIILGLNTRKCYYRQSIRFSILCIYLPTLERVRESWLLCHIIVPMSNEKKMKNINTFVGDGGTRKKYKVLKIKIKTRKSSSLTTTVVI